MMTEIMRKMLLTGVGAVLFTKEKIEETVAEMVNQGGISREEGVGLVNDLVNRANQEREKMNQRMREEIQIYCKNSGLVTQKEFDDLKQTLYSLQERIIRLESNQETQVHYQMSQGD